jgi:hypothetical protein
MTTASRVNRCVFPRDWIETLRRKFDNRPKYEHPKGYEFWTSDECQPYRDRVEEWVESLVSLEKRKGMVRRLRLPRFIEAYNELGVGDSLRRMGYSVEYEAKIEGLTPDWIVHDRQSRSRFIVEVLTSNPPENRERCDAGWDRLRKRLEDIPGDATIILEPWFDPMDDDPVPPPTEEQQQELVRRVREWLETDHHEDEELETDQCFVAFCGRIKSQQHVSCSVGCSPFLVDAAPLREAVREKARKYQKGVQSLAIPFVVCIVPVWESGRDFNELETAALGTEYQKIFRVPGGGNRCETHCKSNGFFSRYPALSAVSLAEWNGQEFAHKLLRNDHATCPLIEWGAEGKKGSKRFPRLLITAFRTAPR